MGKENYYLSLIMTNNNIKNYSIYAIILESNLFIFLINNLNSTKIEGNLLNLYF